MVRPQQCAAPLTVDLRELSIETMQLMVDLKEEAPATGKASQ